MTRRTWTIALVVSVAAVLLTAVPSQAAKAPRARIAYANGGIHSVDLNGRHHLRLTPKTVEAAEPTWSPAGDRIAYLTTRQGDGHSTLRVMRPNGTHKRTLLRGSQARDFLDLSWAPRARRIAVTMENPGGTIGDVGIFSLRTHKLVRLHVLSGKGWHPTGIDWSPDGTRLLFSAYMLDPGNPHELANAELWTIRPNGTGLRRLTNTPTYEYSPAWAPHGKRIAYQEGINCPSISVVIANADGSHPRRVPAGCGGDPDWAPGGDRLVYAAHGPVSGRIALIRPDGTGRTIIASGREPAWRPR